MTNSTEKKDTANNNQKREFLLKILAAATSSILLLYIVYYYFVGSRHIKTENAYVGAEVAQINAAVSGIIKQVNVTDTDSVAVGHILAIIDDADSKLALSIAKANLAKAEAILKQAKSTYKRRNQLRKLDSVSEEELTNAQNDLDAAEASYEAAKISVDQAQLDYERTTIKSPINGIVARRQVQIGQRVQIGTPLMTIVPSDQLHVDANLKEVQLRKIKFGQPVKITSDKYGKSVVYHGRVAGFSGGTGSAFAAIPAQNATGNWIKVVQRVPVRIELDPQELKQYPLQVGLSMHVDIYVGN